MENKYLEKVSSMLGGAIVAHLGQNAITKSLLSSQRYAKSVGNSFVDGVKGVVDKSRMAGVKNFVGGILSPDAVIAKNTAHKVGQSISTDLSMMHKRQLGALRMATRGNFKPLLRRGFHKDPVVLGAAKKIEDSSSFPLHSMLSKAEGNVDKLKTMFQDKKLPLLSNISKNVGKARGSVGPKVTAGVASNKGMLAGAAASAIIDPAAGAINLTKGLASTDKFRSTRIGGALSRKVDDMLIKKPIAKGFNSPSFNKLKNRAYELGVNPVSANLERTSHAVRDLV
jgi:hypothetical protein